MNLTLAKVDRKKIIHDINRLQRMVEHSLHAAAAVMGQQLSERIGKMWKVLAIHPQDSLEQLEGLKTQLMLLNGHLELLPRMDAHISIQDKVRMCREIESLSKRIHNQQVQ